MRITFDREFATTSPKQIAARSARRREFRILYSSDNKQASHEQKPFEVGEWNQGIYLAIEARISRAPWMPGFASPSLYKRSDDNRSKR